MTKLKKVSQATPAGGHQTATPDSRLLLSTATSVLLLLLLALLPVAACALITPGPRADKAQLYQDTNGNLHISSSANQTVFVNDMDMPQRIRQLEAANAALVLEVEAANNNASLSRSMADRLERRLAVLEAIAASNPGSLTNSSTAQPPNASPGTTARPGTTLPPAHPVNNGTRIWSKNFGSSLNFDDAKGIAVDRSDFVYVTGKSQASISNPFDGASGLGNFDGVTVRLTADGISVWTRIFGTTMADDSSAIATDSTNNVYCAANVGGGGSGSLDGNPSFGNNDFVVVKFNNNGVRKWSRQVGSAADDVASAVCVDKEDSVIAAGYTTGAVAGNTKVGSSDILMVKYSGDGSLLWVRQFGTALYDYARALATDIASNIYITGYTRGRLVDDADAGADTATGTTTTSGDLFVAKCDKNGTRLWTRQLGSDEHDKCEGIALDSSGSVYVACNSEGDLDGNFNVGGNDAFVIKFDPSGTKVWSRRLATIADDYAQAIAVDSNNFVYLAGYTNGGLDGNVNLGAGTTTKSDVFVAQYDSDGTLRWLRQYGSALNDAAFGVAVDSNNAVYVTGTTYKGIDDQDILVSKFV